MANPSNTSDTNHSLSSTTTATTIKLKLCRDGDKESIHRFSGNYSFAELDTVIGHLWGGSRPKHGLLLTYFDDEGDAVNFCTQEEWDECLKLHHQVSSSSKGKLLRLAVQRADSPPPSPCNSALSAAAGSNTSNDDEDEDVSSNLSSSTSSCSSSQEETNNTVNRRPPLSFSELFHQTPPEVAPAPAPAPGTQPPSPTSAPIFNSHVDPLAALSSRSPSPAAVVAAVNDDTVTGENSNIVESASLYADDDDDDENRDVEVVTDSFDFAELDGVERIVTNEDDDAHKTEEVEEDDEDDEEQQEEDEVFEYNEEDDDDGDAGGYLDEEHFLYEDQSMSDQLQALSDEMFTCRDAGRLDYLRACMSSLEDRKEEAIELLLNAWAQGYYDPQKLKTDPTLENARAHPRFFSEVLPGGDTKEKLAAELSMHPDELRAEKLKDEKVCNLLAMYPSVTTDGAAAALVAAGGDLQSACEILDGGACRHNCSYSHIPSAACKKTTAQSSAATSKKVGNYRAGETTQVAVKKEVQPPNAGKRIQYGGKKKKNLNRYA